MILLSDIDLKEMYDDMLDDCYQPITICGLEYSPSIALYRVDETAYRCGLNDFIDGLVSDEILVEGDDGFYRHE